MKPFRCCRSSRVAKGTVELGTDKKEELKYVKKKSNFGKFFFEK